MANKKQRNKKLTRVQFPKDIGAKAIVDAIREIQDDWAKRYPERAHRLYPTIYDEAGNRIKDVKKKKAQ